MEKVVYVVHCIDTEGPLYESIQDTFKRLYTTFGIDIEPSQKTLKKLQNMEIELDGREKQVSTFLHPKRLLYNDSWDKIDLMLGNITSNEFRQRYSDSFGGGWIFNWFCVDHVGYTGINPRRRTFGHHSIFDHYNNFNKENSITCDLIQWHYHPQPIIKDMHRSGTAFINSSNIYEILARKIIDRHWFPAVYRPGFHTERPDSNWFLEMWIPFDYGNQSMKKEDIDQPDLSNGRFGDWRRAPIKWLPYHPDIYDYQRQGSCKRFITRCLNMEARLREINADDINDAFKEASNSGKALLSFCNHDFRDMAEEIKKVWTMINSVSNNYKDVKFKFVDAIAGIRNTMNLKKIAPPGFNIKLETKDNSSLLIVNTSNNIFGPQPFLAIKTKTQNYFWDNFDFQDKNNWTYTFDFNTLDIDSVEKIGIAANNEYGITEIVIINPVNKKQSRRILNQN